VRLYDPDAAEPILLKPGDRVRFAASSAASSTTSPPRRRRTLPAGDPMIRVLEPGPQTTVQDAGRAGHNALRDPTLGSVDRPSFVLANRLVGNPDGAARSSSR